MNRKKKLYSRIALAVSLMLMIAWSMMGTGTSLAWFSDTDEEVRNIFHFADFQLKAEYRNDKGEWKDLEGASQLFDDQALYEPGHTQVAYLRVTNLGDVPFDFKTAVSVLDYSEPTNVYGWTFHLQDYLRFGFATAASEVQMDELVDERGEAADLAVNKLSNYATDPAHLDKGATTYMALVVHMPENVTNVANYRDNEIPFVELGIIVTATQKGMPQQ